VIDVGSQNKGSDDHFTRENKLNFYHGGAYILCLDEKAWWIVLGLLNYSPSWGWLNAVGITYDNLGLV